MTGLERPAHRLVELARAGDDPTTAQLRSLHGSVVSRIAAAGALTASTVATSTKAASAGLFVKGLVVAGAVAAGAAGFFAVSRAPEVDPTPAAFWAPTTAPLALPLQASAQPTSEGAAVEETAPASEAPSPAPRSGKPTPSLRLQDEAALLAEVQGSLRNGKGSVALSKLESYDRKFPAGMLRAEADAAKVFALCSAGRVEKSRAAAARFVQRYPNAPATARVQAACR